ncbi:YegP family protein [Arthrobacter sp. IA7]|uniref:YegP family protein n=1 Tax=Arthrobacter ipis TaxID=2716202 RepID=UPI0016834B1C|nr:YegP family protein [Arthrobacter ipis]MBD1542832.1 YegP family protein [Arthrobacter ipis]
MAAVFEVFVDAESQFRFRLKAPDGSVLAISAPFEDKRAAAAGIADVRECAGTGLIADLSPAAAPVTGSASVTGAQVQAAVPAPAPAQVLPARPDHRRQGFGTKRTPSEAPGSPLCRPAAAAEPPQPAPRQLMYVMKGQRESAGQSHKAAPTSHDAVRL